MRTFRQVAFLFGLVLLASPALAHHISGAVYCDVDASNSFTAADLPLAGITVTVTPQGAAGQPNRIRTIASGVHYNSVLAVTETYVVSLTAGMPAGSSIVLPAGGTHTASIVTGVTRNVENVDFLLRDCSPCTTKSCDDDNECTADSCTPKGCVHTNVTKQCSDGNACTVDDACVKGTCTGTTRTCNDQNACTDDTCNPASGCVFTNNAAPCNDKNACTQTDVCSGGQCVGSHPVTCVSPDQCKENGTCDPTTGQCSHPAKPNDTPCNDANACTQSDTCQGGQCTGRNPKTCIASDQCHDPGTCDPQTGTCSNPAKPDGSTCTDGSACTQKDSCQGGTCVGGAPKTCTASDQCHDPGTCDPQTGNCSNPPKPNGSTCNDGNLCTTPDSCQGGVCSGTPKSCPAGDACEENGVCDPATGNCANAPKPDGTPCDGDICVGPSVCQGGQCVGGGSAEPAFLFCSEARINRSANINGNIGVNAAGGSLRLSRNSRVADHCTTTADDLTLGNNASVDDVKANAVHMSRGASIRGTTTQASLPIVTPCCPIADLTCGGNEISIGRNQSGSSNPGTYGDLAVQNNGTLLLMAGTYNVCSVSLGRGAEVRTMGAVTINVAGDVRIADAAVLGPKAGSPHPNINLEGDSFRIGSNGKVTGIIKGPNATGRFGRSATVEGRLCLDSAGSDHSLQLQCPCPPPRP